MVTFTPQHAHYRALRVLTLHKRAPLSGLCQQVTHRPDLVFLHFLVTVRLKLDVLVVVREMSQGSSRNATMRREEDARVKALTRHRACQRRFREKPRFLQAYRHGDLCRVYGGLSRGASDSR